jgi:hypothetical protein
MTAERTTRSASSVRRLLLVALVVVIAALAAGCGKKSEPMTPAKWADGVCSSISTWKNSLTAAAQPLTSGNLSKSSLQSAAADAKSATDTLQSDLKDLGKPNTQAGQQAQDQINKLGSDLQTDVDTIKSAVDGVSGVSGIAAAVTTATTTFSTMQTQVSSTLTSLQQLDAKGELTTAFQQSDSCKQLTGGS